MAAQCWCGFPPVIRQDTNNGDFYYSCPLPLGHDLRCDMQVWEDEADLPGAFSPPGESDSETESDNEIVVEMPPGKCMCGLDAQLWQDELIGRKFLTCHYDPGHLWRCPYLEWEDLCLPGDEMEPVLYWDGAAFVHLIPVKLRGNLVVFVSWFV